MRCATPIWAGWRWCPALVRNRWCCCILLSVIAPETPVLFIDTRMLFPETLDYQRKLAEKLNLCDIRTIRATHPRACDG